MHLYVGSGWDSTAPVLKVENDETGATHGHGLWIKAGSDNASSYSLIIYDHSSNADFYVKGDGAVWANSFSKGSGSFDITHPTRGGDWRLRHSFIEGPQADNIYRGTVTLSGGTATVDLDAVSNMTDGTWEALNRDPWAMVASSGNAVEWSLSGKTLTVTSDTADAVCSWMVIGERQDATMVESPLADDEGRLIVEHEEEDTLPDFGDTKADIEIGEAEAAQVLADQEAAEAAAAAAA
jgi:hypothetical protein